MDKTLNIGRILTVKKPTSYNLQEVGFLEINKVDADGDLGE